MARTIQVIKQSMLDSIAADPTLSILLTSTSKVSVFGLFVYVVAVCAFAIENLHDLFISDVNDVIDQQGAHTPQWYVNMAKAFQYGYNLVPEKDYYDNTGIDPTTVDASKIVAYAAFVEEPFVRLKLAKLVNGSLAKLADDERTSVVAFIMRIKDAGVKLKNETITSTDPDKLKLSLRIKFNPLVLNISGGRIDGTQTAPVADAVRGYLSNLDFNGLFSAQKLVDAIQAVDGVEDLHVDLIQTKYGNLLFTSVDIDFIPDSGYLVIDDADLNITYIPS